MAYVSTIAQPPVSILDSATPGQLRAAALGLNVVLWLSIVSAVQAIF